MDATVILNFIQEKFPELFVIIIISTVIWYIAKFYYKRFKPAEDKINNAPCNKGNDFYNNVAELKSNVNDIKKYIFKNDPSFAYEMFIKFSPLRLTEKGQLLLEKSSGKKCIDENLDFFINEVKKENPKVALDIENYALNILYKNKNMDLFNNIKNFVYNVPSPYKTINDKGEEIEFMQTIDIYVVIKVMSLYLRDKFLERYPEYNPNIE